MTSHQIYKIYGIDERDLPIGSRYKRNYFRSEIHKNYRKLSDDIAVSGWSPMKLIKSKKYKNDIPNFNHSVLYNALKQSIADIGDNNSNLSLIPTLKVDTVKKVIYCESLIPIQVNSKWIAISYETVATAPSKIVITGIYIDCDDIIKKAALLDPNAIDTYKWLKGSDLNGLYDLNPSFSIESLQYLLNHSLETEKLLFSILQQKKQMLKQKEFEFQSLFINTSLPYISNPIAMIPSYNMNNIQNIQ